MKAFLAGCVAAVVIAVVAAFVLGGLGMSSDEIYDLKVIEMKREDQSVGQRRNPICQTMTNSRSKPLNRGVPPSAKGWFLDPVDNQRL